MGTGANTASLATVISWFNASAIETFDRAAMESFFRSPHNCQRFLDALYAGEPMLPNMIKVLFQEQHRDELWSVLNADPRWNTGAKGIPDASYTDAVYQMWWEKWGSVAGEKALAQLVRMLYAGRADLLFVRDFFNEDMLYNKNAVVHYREYLAYDSAILRLLTNRQQSLRSSRRANPNEISPPYAAAIIYGNTRREALWRTVWLPAQISAEEWAEVKDFSPSVLRGLYSNLWEAGYRDYRKRILLKKSK